MRRSEVLLTAFVAAFAIFVGVQVVTRPARHAPAAPTPTRQLTSPSRPRSSTRAAVAVTALGDAPIADPVTSATPPAATAPLIDDAAQAGIIRSRIAAATSTYMADMLGDLKGSLVRWPDRREQGLRVWVQSATSVRDWDLRYAQMARDAFSDWNANLPMRLDFVLDSASSDVRITWVDRFTPDFGQRVGTTNRVNDERGWLVRADIVIAVHDSAGRTIPPAGLVGIVRHEAGHALGLGHSKDPATKMFPVEMAAEISPADRATLRLLYRLPPGPVRER